MAGLAIDAKPKTNAVVMGIAGLWDELVPAGSKQCTPTPPLLYADVLTV